MEGEQPETTAAGDLDEENVNGTQAVAGSEWQKALDKVVPCVVVLKVVSFPAMHAGFGAVFLGVGGRACAVE